MERLKKWNVNLNVIIGSFIGIFIGSSIYIYFDYKKHSDLYEMQSEPWYTGIQIYGLGAVIVISIAIILKLLIKKKLKNN